MIDKHKITQASVILKFFKQNPNRDIAHPEIVDWATAEYQKQTGQTFRDPDRQIRKFHQEGKLIKVRKGVYRFDPKFEIQKNLEDFTPKQKLAIFKRDRYRCVICGAGTKDGVELQIDHIKPKDRGGKAVISNGQTLCGTHNYRKKHYNQTETGKKMFINLYELAKKADDKNLKDFCKEVLEVYDYHKINGHIEWDE